MQAKCLCVGLLQPIVQELTNLQDPLTCLSALSLLKEQTEQVRDSNLQSQLAAFFLPHLEKLLAKADAVVKPMVMQASFRLCLLCDPLKCDT